MSGGEMRSGPPSEAQAARKRKLADSASVLPREFAAVDLNPTRYSKGMAQLGRPCVLCMYSNHAPVTEATTESMGVMEQSSVFDKIDKLWTANVDSMELMPLAEQCATMVAELRAASTGDGDGILDSIDTQTVYMHMMHHKSCRTARLSRLRQAFFNMSQLERVAADSLYVKEKHGRMMADAGVADIHRRAVTSLLALNNALTKEEAAQHT